MKPARVRMLLLTVAVVLLLVAGAGYLTGAPTRDAGRVYLANEGGGVLFDHAAHEDAVDRCSDCHHTLLTGSGHPGCLECHDEDYEYAAFDSHDEMLALHAEMELGLACTDCHAVAADDQARDCRQCHADQAADPVGGDGSCAGCHEDGYEPDLFDSHGEMAELHAGADVGCGGCHAVSAVADAYHQQCNGCHLALDEAERFADEDGGGPRCERCHLQ